MIDFLLSIEELTKTALLCLCILILFCHTSKGDDLKSGKEQLNEIAGNIIEMLDRGEKCTDDYLRRNLHDLLIETIEKNQEVWKKSKERLSMLDFLPCNLGVYKNPFFEYSLSLYMHFIDAQEENFEMKQETCYQLLLMLKDYNYIKFHSVINSAICLYLGNRIYFSDKSKKLLMEIIRDRIQNKRRSTIEDARDRRYSTLNLLFMEKEDVDAETMALLKVEARNTKSESIIYGKIPFISLVFLAKINEEDYLKRLLNYMHENGRYIGIDRAEILFRFVSFVRRKEIVMVLGEYLKSDTVIDRGEDVMDRYVGHSMLAAASLFIMLEGFPEISEYDYKDDDKKRCIQWFENQQSFNYKTVNWNSRNETVERIRHIIFGI